MEKLEALRRTTSSGRDYWHARDIGPVLGYPTWREFENVIMRAVAAATGVELDPAKHFVPTHKMMEVGGGGVREGDDYFLSRPAAYLIAMNGDPSKPEISAAQAYFTIQTRRMELEDQRLRDEKRLEAREKLQPQSSGSEASPNRPASAMTSKGIFHDQRWLGLYGKSAAYVKVDRG